MGYEKIWSFFWYQNLQKFEKKKKKSEKIGAGSLTSLVPCMLMLW